MSLLTFFSYVKQIFAHILICIPMRNKQTYTLVKMLWHETDKIITFHWSIQHQQNHVVPDSFKGEHVNTAWSANTWRQHAFWPIAASFSSLWVYSKCYELCLHSLFGCTDERGGGQSSQASGYAVGLFDSKNWKNLGASAEVSELAALRCFSVGFCFQGEPGRTEIQGEERAVYGPLQSESPETRPVVDLWSFVFRRVHLLEGRRQRERTRAEPGVVGTQCCSPRRAARQSMLNNEPKGHTGSFVRRRVSQTMHYILSKWTVYSFRHKLSYLIATTKSNRSFFPHSARALSVFCSTSITLARMRLPVYPLSLLKWLT